MSTYNAKVSLQVYSLGIDDRQKSQKKKLKGTISIKRSKPTSPRYKDLVKASIEGKVEDSNFLDKESFSISGISYLKKGEKKAYYHLGLLLVETDQVQSTYYASVQKLFEEFENFRGEYTGNLYKIEAIPKNFKKEVSEHYRAQVHKKVGSISLKLKAQ